MQSWLRFFCAAVVSCASNCALLGGAPEPIDPLAWPILTREARPGAYWWWMGSAVDTTNLTRELTRYRDAGLGGVHIIPIYGAKSWEDRYLEYLSPRWMEMLGYTVTEAGRLGLNVDMTTGSGWCFGGPRVTDAEANASVVWQTFEVAAGERLPAKLEAKAIQTLMALGPEGQRVELTGKLAANGTLDWTAPGGSWRLCAVSQRPSGQQVKRAAPGGQGHMLNLLYAPAMTDYLRWFDAAFTNYAGPMPRAQYHDSYEYRSDWAPDFLAQFAKRRGYRLQDELPALFANAQPPRARGAAGAGTANFGPVDRDRAARVKCDFRETVSDIMVEDTLPLWANWARRHGCLTRNEAHGSPGNWLDLYAVADIPETEMFYQDRSKLIAKFASSAAHVTGKPLVSAETGTWLKEHFTETLADMKYLLDDLFLSGVNHVFYHGTCYSPDEVGWPGWLFYASYEMNPRNSIWRDMPALNAYAARCQSVLQNGRPDNDILLYWPLPEFWHNSTGLARNLTVHARDWFEDQPIGQTASNLWSRGYAFDYVSDRQLAAARATPDGIQVPGGTYRVVVVPPCQLMPFTTLSNLIALARAGATVIFEKSLPADVPGFASFEAERAALRQLLADAHLSAPATAGTANESAVGAGRVRVGELEVALKNAQVPSEPMFAREGLMCIRRAAAGGYWYFIANRTETAAMDGWVRLGRPAASAVILDPMTGRTGAAALRQGDGGTPEVFLQLAPGESVVLHCFDQPQSLGAAWVYRGTAQHPVPLPGTWQVQFLAGGPIIPAAFTTAKLASWTEFGDPDAQRFAGTARYSLRFERPSGDASSWQLDLGQVCQSARVRLNGEDWGTLIAPPFRVVVSELKPTDNLLEIEVTNGSANRIRDLDRRGVPWKTFHDINFVNLDYKPFDASNWPLTPSGLLGPVTLAPLAPVAMPR